MHILVDFRTLARLPFLNSPCPSLILGVEPRGVNHIRVGPSPDTVSDRVDSRYGISAGFKILDLPIHFIEVFFCSLH